MEKRDSKVTKRFQNFYTIIKRIKILKTSLYTSKFTFSNFINNLQPWSINNWAIHDLDRFLYARSYSTGTETRNFRHPRSAPLYIVWITSGLLTDWSAQSTLNPHTRNKTSRCLWQWIPSDSSDISDVCAQTCFYERVYETYTIFWRWPLFFW